MNAPQPSPVPEPEIGLTKADIVPAMTVDQLEDLRRMRVVGMNFIERLERRGAGLLRFVEQEAFEGSDVCLDFARVSRAVRQVIVLEQETVGLRQPPLARAANRNVASSPSDRPRHAAQKVATEETEYDRERSDYDDYDDYSDAPTEVVVSQVRRTLKQFAGGTSLSTSSLLGIPEKSDSSPRHGRRLDSRAARKPAAGLAQAASFGGAENDGVGAAHVCLPHGRDPP